MLLQINIRKGDDKYTKRLAAYTKKDRERSELYF